MVLRGEKKSKRQFLPRFGSWYLFLFIGTLPPGLRTADVKDITQSGSDLLNTGDTRGYFNKSKRQIRARIKKDAKGQGLVLPRVPVVK